MAMRSAAPRGLSAKPMRPRTPALSRTWVAGAAEAASVSARSPPMAHRERSP